MPVQKLTPSFREKVWGATDLTPWFPVQQTKIGEVWFESEAPLPLLVKFLFTSERLSVQVHPGDDYARKHENSPGKTEMWHVLRAEGDARIALGFRERLSRETLRRVSETGEIEHLLNWVPVEAGDSIYAPAGTVHAIGPGLALCEIQQVSDITYRLHDYGRPRELHLNKAMDVANTEPHPGKAVPRPLPDGFFRLVCCEHFCTEKAVVSTEVPWRLRGSNPEILVVLEGTGYLENQAFDPGEAWLVDEPVVLQPQGTAVLLRTYVPAAV
ncbi:MAG: class I mannose-6-phosphate isomerase [Bryobacterales bacterium]|nr:class I mannose-6-phosphate isomerase [Bryobacterales bacterium]